MERVEQEAQRKVRFAVVGLGTVAQAGVLPAFANATENCELAAFVSDDPLKHKKLGKRYRVSLAYSYDDYDACLKSGEIDAVYLAVPPKMRKDFAVRAAEAGIHVIAERPLAPTEQECEAVLRAAQRRKVRLLTAYRLYQQEGNVKAIEFCRAGKIGEPRTFVGVLTVPARAGEPRPDALSALGIDAVHMARKLFGAEPVEAFAWTTRFAGAGPGSEAETISALLRFPGERVASFTVGFHPADASYFHVFGSRGDLRCDPAFDSEGESRHIVTLQGKRKERLFDAREPFAPLLLQFADCVIQGREPEVGVSDALADARVLRALERSLQEGHPVRPVIEAPPAPEAKKPVVRRAEFASPLSQGGRGIPAPLPAAAPAAPKRG